MDVTIEKCGNVVGGCRDLVLFQDADHDSGIGHAGDFDIVEVVVDAKAFSQRALERFDAGAAGMNQGAVDVEKQQTFLHSSTDYADFCRWYDKSRRAHHEYG